MIPEITSLLDRSNKSLANDSLFNILITFDSVLSLFVKTSGRIIKYELSFVVTVGDEIIELLLVLLPF